MDNEYEIDLAGKDGSIRVTFLSPTGYTVEREFNNRLAAQEWIDFMLSLEE